ncbi:UTP--glucose-1-phosphate uridylyltransferase GalU [Alkalihalobacillus sp. MEB130]|uniref:UTP--glucose-1-phosphate uridylyltransferase GalU n=1 Tax=Alkalihalobacillus sp. MEB130 TaxID=2976704 RepID=UPI0028DD5DF5|nr:UTP--glucose-1-phosphate uridylyltransferase GalU [Alkalihalobacillus sp. MEB130]MDT8858818.1 UTP--glucose-1-phosphate uridylyltransferase GalU [Alkalihalobacillus sp. MEB130]
MKVKKAIIPAAGLGTRFLPATKAQPKEMLPIVDKPTIQYIVEEAVKSGIEDILIITGRGKRAIEDHFDRMVELEEELRRKEKEELLKTVQQSTDLLDIHYIRQKTPSGLGHAVYCARKFIGNEPFAVLLGDDIVKSEQTPCLQQMMELYEEHESPIIGVQEVSDDEVERYGIVDCEPFGKGVHKVKKLVEKPTKAEAPSNIAIMGRYILTPDIFDILANTAPGKGKEIQLTDALQALSQKRDVLAYEFHGTRYDVGEKLGFIQTTIEFALDRADLKDEMEHYLKELVEKRFTGK